jgi:hypothetical protein
VEVREYVDCQPPRRILPHAFKDCVAQVIEQDPAKTRTGIGRDKADGEADASLKPRLHPVNRGGINKAHADLNRL